jgi:hypothetical protein
MVFTNILTISSNWSFKKTGTSSKYENFISKMKSIIFTHHMQIFHNVYPMNYHDKLYMEHRLKFDLKMNVNLFYLSNNSLFTRCWIHLSMSVHILKWIGHLFIKRENDKKSNHWLDTVFKIGYHWFEKKKEERIFFSISSSIYIYLS